ncbi:MAG: hypothetical protein K6G75_06855 [Lachnospiraceae bacterium]|nr:hypothetical protein [Lachnospiraceae bacterium]
MDDNNSRNAFFYLILTILAVGVSIIFAPIIIDSLSSYIYKKQKPSVKVKINKNNGPRIVRKKGRKR